MQLRRRRRRSVCVVVFCLLSFAVAKQSPRAHEPTSRRDRRPNAERRAEQRATAQKSRRRSGPGTGPARAKGLGSKGPLGKRRIAAGSGGAERGGVHPPPADPISAGLLRGGVALVSLCKKRAARASEREGSHGQARTERFCGAFPLSRAGVTASHSRVDEPTSRRRRRWQNARDEQRSHRETRSIFQEKGLFFGPIEALVSQETHFRLGGRRSSERLRVADFFAPST